MAIGVERGLRPGASRCVVPGVAMLIMALFYWRYTQDCRDGNFEDLRASGVEIGRRQERRLGAASSTPARNYRVWMLFVTYAAPASAWKIFIHNIAAIYYVDHVPARSLKAAGLAGRGSFGLLALFARALGGWLSDKVAATPRPRHPLDAAVRADRRRRQRALLVRANAESVALAVVAMLVFGLLHAHGLWRDLRARAVHRPQGAGRRGRHDRRGRQRRRGGGGLPDEGHRRRQQTPSMLGMLVAVAALCALAVRFSPEHKAREAALRDRARRHQQQHCKLRAIPS